MSIQHCPIYETEGMKVFISFVIGMNSPRGIEELNPGLQDPEVQV